MAVRKIAISLPEAVLRQIDAAAAERGLTRSRFISDVARLVARARTDAEITRRLNRLFSDTDVAREQVRTAESFGRAGVEQGTEW